MEVNKEDQSAPESWEQHTGGNSPDNADTKDSLSSAFSLLNVDAPPFVPSFLMGSPQSGDETNGPSSEHLAEAQELKMDVEPPPADSGGSSADGSNEPPAGDPTIGNLKLHGNTS